MTRLESETIDTEIDSAKLLDALAEADERSAEDGVYWTIRSMNLPTRDTLLYTFWFNDSEGNNYAKRFLVSGYIIGRIIERSELYPPTIVGRAYEKVARNIDKLTDLIDYVREI